MLARAIPDEIQAAMSASDAINLGWARNFTRPDGSSRQGYPGWELLKQHCSATDVAQTLNEYDAGSVPPPSPLNPESWDELEAQVKGRIYPILPGLMLLLAKATGKTVFVTNVYCGDSDGTFNGIDVYRVSPDGERVVHEV